MMILVINPGSTSTKIAVYGDNKELFSENISHSIDQLGKYKRIVDQKDFRRELINEVLKKRNIDDKKLNAVVGRGGLLKPIPSGTYKVNSKMLEDLNNGLQGEHASNLGGILAYEIASPLKIPAFIVDPVVVDELNDAARITGIAEIKRRSIFHALNHKYTARLAAQKLGKEYNDVNLIVAHLGGGISVAAHCKGKVIDVNNALNGEGPITPERAGTLPAWDLVELALSGKYSKEELKKMITGKGGVVALLGTNDMREVENRVKSGDKDANLIFEAMAYGIAKEIGSCAATLKGRVDGIVITGGFARWKEFIELIKERISFIGEIFIFPGENEMEALAAGAMRILKGETEAIIYN
ncbi:MAG: butyrate kinase [bacterium]|nr:butyrate kinase [bacterium]